MGLDLAGQCGFLADDFGSGSNGRPPKFHHHSAHALLRIRSPQTKSDVSCSVAGAEKIDGTPEMQRKRIKGVKAEEKEMANRAGRWAVVFGLPVPQNTGLGRRLRRMVGRRASASKMSSRRRSV